MQELGTEKMPKARYRLNVPTIALEDKGGHRAAVSLREGTAIDVVGPAKDDSRFLIVDVDGQQLEIFGLDLTKKCSFGSAA